MELYKGYNTPPSSPPSFFFLYPLDPSFLFDFPMVGSDEAGGPLIFFPSPLYRVKDKWSILSFFPPPSCLHSFLVFPSDDEGVFNHPHLFLLFFFLPSNSALHGKRYSILTFPLLPLFFLPSFFFLKSQRQLGITLSLLFPFLVFERRIDSARLPPPSLSFPGSPFFF